MYTQKKEGQGPLGAARRLLIEQGCIYLLFAGLGALLGSAELLFGVRPFGVALAAASGAPFPAVALGNAIFALFTKDYLSVAALGIVALLRLGFSLVPTRVGEAKPPLFGERIGFRAISAAVAIFGVALFRLIRGEFRYYYLLALILGTLVAGLGAVLLSGIFLTRERLFPYSKEAGLAALLLMGIFAIREVSFFGIYPGGIAAALVAFWLCAHYGLAAGAVGGLLVGACFDLTLAPAFLLCALGFGLLEKSSRGGGILAGCGVATAYVFAVVGTEGITALLPSLLTAGALFLAGDSAGLVEGSPAQRILMLRRRGAAQAARELEGAHSGRCLREISGAFTELSGILYELSGAQRRPGVLDLRHLCDREFDKFCPRCAHRDICWGKEYAATAAAVGAMASNLHTAGVVDRAQIPGALVARCRSIASILEGVEQGAQQLCEETLRGDKTSVVAMDYAALGRMLSETLERSHEAHVIDTATGERIAGRLQRMGYQFESVCVCGKTHRRVLLRGVRLPGRHIKLRELRAVLEQHCHFPLGEAESTQSEGMTDILFPERRVLRTSTVKETRAKSARENGYCGDSVTSLSTADGYEYAFLCDGMGSGNQAALTSALAATVLSRFLGAGNRADTSLRILNGVMAARGRRENEASTTVDLLEVDCISGEATLLKCGAAPTYLLRAGATTRFFSHTAPLGILEALDAERIRFEVQPGDVLVQVSDGVTGGEEECPWLSDLLVAKWDGDAESFARLVLNRAGERGRDDLSILITTVEQAAAPGVEDAPRAAS